MSDRGRSSGRRRAAGCGQAGKGELWVLAALAAAALLGWYFLSASEPPAAGAPSASPRAVAASETEPAVVAGDVSRGEPAAGENDRGDLARAIIEELREEGKVDPEQVFERAERFQAVGMLADAYLLHFYAARQGHARAALALARMYDPNTFARESSILEAPDVAQAHKWYHLAARAGDPGAKRELADLRGRVERAAARGDEESRRLMMQWR